jgi:hypothetical protein
MFAELRCKNSIDTFVANGQGQSLPQRGRDARARPNLSRLLDGNRGEVGFGENFKSVTAFFPGRKRADAGFQFTEVFQPVENSTFQERVRFRMF